jgi:hypothetical protein
MPEADPSMAGPVEFAGPGRARFGIRFTGFAADGSLSIRAQLAVAGASAEVDAALTAEDVIAFWLQLDALCRGGSEVAVLTGLAGTPHVEVRARSQGAALRVRLRGGDGAERFDLRAECAVGRPALASARAALAEVLAVLPPSGGQLLE